MAQTEEPAPAVVAAPRLSANKLLPIILVVNVAMMGAVLFMVMRKPAASAPASVEAPAPSEHGEAASGGRGPGPGPVLKLENFVIQLRGVDQDRYVRVAFDVEVTGDADKEIVQARLPQIRDSVITYFSDRTLDELRGSEGIERTKTALLKRLDEIVPGHRVRALYITDFIIQ